MAKIKVKQIENLGFFTDENGTIHMVVGGEIPEGLTPLNEVVDENEETIQDIEN